MNIVEHHRIISETSQKHIGGIFMMNSHIRMHCSSYTHDTSGLSFLCEQLLLIKFHQIIKKDEFYCCLYRVCVQNGFENNNLEYENHHGADDYAKCVLCDFNMVGFELMGSFLKG